MYFKITFKTKQGTVRSEFTQARNGAEAQQNIMNNYPNITKITKVELTK